MNIKKNILLVLFVLISISPIALIAQQECPDNYDLPDDSDVSHPNCGNLNIDEGIIIINDDPCTFQFQIELDFDIPMSTIVTDDIYLDIHLVDENLNFENILCFDNIVIVNNSGLEEGTDCDSANTLTYTGTPIALVI